MSTGQRTLLMTMTNEPFQPVRLSYEIPGRAFVLERLRAMSCVVEAPRERCWHWLFHGEAASVRFSHGSYDDVPVERRPIILGRIRLPKRGGMTIQANSSERAVEAARFFAPRLGPEVVLRRVRVVNRFFAADEGTPDELMATLDRNVTVIDPSALEQELEHEFQGARTLEEMERAAAERVQRRIERGDDVPLVEDFPLYPEEESPDFRDLDTTLRWRLIRAYEHWRGNTHLTLAAIIRRVVDEQFNARGLRGRSS